MSCKRCVKGFIIFILGAGAGAAGNEITASLYEPSREVLVQSKSPDGRFNCVVERFEPPWLGDQSEGVPWRVLKVCQADGDNAEPIDDNSSFVMHEHMSGGWEIGGMSNQVQWRGSKAFVLFDHEPWFEIEPYDPKGWQGVQATTVATTQPIATK